MAKRTLLMLWGLVLAVALVAAPASADVAWEWSTTTNSGTAGSYSIGAQFNITASYTVRYLGFYDDLGDGLTQSHAVGIWDSDQNLLTTATVVSGDPLIGHFRWAAVTPIVLQTNDNYRIAAVTGSENYSWGNTGFFTDSRVVYVRSAYTPSNVLVFPGGFDSNIGYFGPNFSDVPVPPTAWLLASGLLGLAGLRRKFSR